MSTTMPPKSSRAFKASSNFQEIVTMKIGPDETTYYVHKCFATKSSRFLKNALNGDWKESADKTIRLPTEEPRSFELYIHWLYHGVVPTRNEMPHLFGASEIMQLVRLYCSADRLLDEKFKNALIDAFIKNINWHAGTENPYPSPRVITYIFENTPKDSKLRLLMIDAYVFRGKPDWFHLEPSVPSQTAITMGEDDGMEEEEGPEFPLEFVYGLLSRLLPHQPTSTGRSTGRSQSFVNTNYYTHGPKK